jgi:type I restriction enzyme, S subunit
MTSSQIITNTLRLRDVAVKIGSGITPHGGRDSYVPYGVPLIRSQNVNSGRLLLDKVAYITEEQDEAMANTRVCAGDVLLNITGASIGRSCVVPNGLRRGNVNQHVCIIRCNGQINPAFLQAYLASHRGQHQIMQLQAGGGRQGINFREIGNIRLPNLTRKEQAEVVDVLATADRAIAGVEKLIAAKRTLKKGLAQQLLTGQRRLPGFNRPWAHLPLRKLCDITYGQSQSGIVCADGRFPIYGTGGIVGMTDRFLHKGPAVILGRKGSIDRPLLVAQPFWAIDTAFYATPAKGMSAGWLYQMFLTINWRKYNEASGVPSLSRETVYGIHCDCPQWEEQERIAFVLGAADREIALLEKKLAALRELKKGLMQKLLSGSDRVSTSGHDHLRDIRKKV